VQPCVTAIASRRASPIRRGARPSQFGADVRQWRPATDLREPPRARPAL